MALHGGFNQVITSVRQGGRKVGNTLMYGVFMNCDGKMGGCFTKINRNGIEVFCISKESFLLSFPPIAGDKIDEKKTKMQCKQKLPPPENE